MPLLGAAERVLGALALDRLALLTVDGAPDDDAATAPKAARTNPSRLSDCWPITCTVRGVVT